MEGGPGGFPWRSPGGSLGVPESPRVRGVPLLGLKSQALRLPKMVKLRMPSPPLTSPSEELSTQGLSSKRLTLEVKVPKAFQALINSPSRSS